MRNWVVHLSLGLVLSLCLTSTAFAADQSRGVQSTRGKSINNSRVAEVQHLLFSTTALAYQQRNFEAGKKHAESFFEKRDLTFFGVNLFTSKASSHSFQVRSGFSDLTSKATAGVELSLSW